MRTHHIHKHGNDVFSDSIDSVIIITVLGIITCNLKIYNDIVIITNGLNLGIFNS